MLQTLREQPRLRGNPSLSKFSNHKTEGDLKQIFSHYGSILSIAVKRNERHKKLFAFVEFQKPSDAAEAVDK